MSLLEVEDLDLSIAGKQLLTGLNFKLEAGETLGLVGESGSGKSLTAMSIMQLLPQGKNVSGDIRLDGTSLPNADEAVLDAMRGNKMAMVFQEPMTSLNPLQTIGAQVAEGPILHLGVSPAEAEEMACAALLRVGMQASHMRRFPHELSGGQRQRVMIAIASVLKPKLLIADEPTSALDVSTQREVLDLLKELTDEQGAALILISHDLAVVGHLADRLIVMRDGQMVEHGKVPQVFDAFESDYAKKLVANSSLEYISAKHSDVSDQNEVAVEAKQICKSYSLPRQSLFEKRQYFHAVDHVDLKIKAGSRVGLVGESGCGKSTLARLLLGLDKPSDGDLFFGAQSYKTLAKSDTKQLRRSIQIVFQDPSGSFNPRHKIGRVVAEPLALMPEIGGAEKEARVVDVLGAVGLPQDAIERYPHEFSGGQRQRIAIARAIITRPSLVVADEPVSALDVSVRGEILELFNRLAAENGMSYLFISHDLHVVRAVTDEVLVMQKGQIVEEGKTQSVFESPQHAYTKMLLAASLNLPSVLAKRRDEQD